MEKHGLSMAPTYGLNPYPFTPSLQPAIILRPAPGEFCVRDARAGRDLAACGLPATGNSRATGDHSAGATEDHSADATEDHSAGANGDHSAGANGDYSVARRTRPRAQRATPAGRPQRHPLANPQHYPHYPHYPHVYPQFHPQFYPQPQRRAAEAHVAVFCTFATPTPPAAMRPYDEVLRHTVEAVCGDPPLCALR
eukprot:351055-Chlamydomonas_euryale.AAC.5